MDNATIARRLMDYAHELEAHHESLYRVRAYRRAAAIVLGLERPLGDLFAEVGRAGLAALPGIGAHLAYTLEGLLLTGEWRTLRPLAGTADGRVGRRSRLRFTPQDTDRDRQPESAA
jgi:DNA polymerase/3'-5' exonuclease PolX